MLGKRLINSNDAASGVCASDEVDVFGDNSGVALYQLNWDGSDMGGNYDGITTNISFSNGKIDDAAKFNGSSSYISIAATNTTPLDLSQENYSISAWVKFDTFSGDRGIIAKWGGSASLRSILWWVSNGSIKIIEGGSADSIQSSTATLSSTGTWYHLVYTRAASESKIYINGSLDSTFSRTQTIRQGGTEPYYLGSQSAGQYKELDGDIDQFRTFNKVLSLTEVTTLYNEAACDKTCTTDTPQLVSNCVAYYELDGNAEDSNGTGTVYDGAPTNVSFVGGRFRSAASFNGTSSRIPLPKITGITADVSVSGWVNLGNTTTSNRIRFIEINTDASGFAGTLSVYYKPSNGEWQVRSGNGENANSNVLTHTYLLTQTTFYNVCFTRDDNTNITKFYINGSLQDTETVTVSGGSTYPGNATSIIGDINYSASNFNWLGKIDQVRIYSKALIQSEVTTLYNEVACPSGNFNTVLYTGNGSSQAISTVGFQPDLVWIKERSNGSAHNIADVIRGSTNYLSSDIANGQLNLASTITSFDASGFSVGNDGGVNQGSQTYVAWNWKAGGDPSANTNGTIASDVSANTAAGFSIVNYSGSGGIGSTGHSLLSTPQFVIVKNLTSHNTNWQTWYDGAGTVPANQIQRLFLNTSGGNDPSTSNVYYPDSTKINFASGDHFFNNSGQNYIAYCWHSVAGYSSIGKYTGNGSSTGPIVDTGFIPKFVLIKATTNDNGGGSWLIYDSARSPSNPRNKRLYPDLSLLEQSLSNYDLDFLTGATKGFQPKDGASSYGYNTLNVEYIYMSFA